MLDPHFDVRPIQTSDSSLVLDFLRTAQFTHRHLDWRLPVDWLGEQPFLGCWYHDDLTALLVCPITEGKEVWIRCYSGQSFHSMQIAWDKLLTGAVAQLRKKDVGKIYTIALSDWYRDLLVQTGFQEESKIVILEKTNWSTRPLHIQPPEIQISEMDSQHLDAVYELDRKCFQPLWQLTREDISIAYKHAINCSVAFDPGNNLVAYQISNLIGETAHLARIAVDPTYQRKTIANMLLSNLLKRFAQMGITKVTVNTQSDNVASLRLYQQNGFLLTGENYPIYALNT